MVCRDVGWYYKIAMKVTKISQQVKRPDRYSIYIDENYSFSLNEYQLAGSGLRLGKELSADELDAFMQDSLFGKAYERSLNYVMIRPRSEREISEYLTRTFLYPKPRVFMSKTGERVIKKQEVDKVAVSRMIERVMNRLREKKYINDETFARAWIESREFSKKTSKRRLQQELQQKGVAQEIIATVLQNSDVNELDNLRALIVKKRRLSRYQDIAKLFPYLVRQGYSYSDVKDALGEDYAEE